MPDGTRSARPRQAPPGQLYPTLSSRSSAIPRLLSAQACALESLQLSAEERSPLLQQQQRFGGVVGEEGKSSSPGGGDYHGSEDDGDDEEYSGSEYRSGDGPDHRAAARLAVPAAGGGATPRSYNLRCVAYWLTD